MERHINIHNKPITPEDLDRYEQLLKEAFHAPWWREFIRLIEKRRNDFLERLCNGNLDQRQEDRLRGEISNCSYIISIDEAGDQLNDPVLQEKLQILRREQNGRRERTA